MDRTQQFRRRADFWRACRYLYPHRRLVVISVLSALVVGAAFTGGLSTLLPIMQVLMNGDTVQDWLNRRIVEKRLGVRLAEDNAELRIVRLMPGSPVADLPAGVGQVLSLPGAAGPGETGRQTLKALAEPQAQRVSLRVDGSPPRELRLAPVPAHQAAAQKLLRYLPDDPSRPVRTIAAVLGVLIALALFGNIVRFFQEYLSEKAAILAVRDIRTILYDHSLHLHLEHYGKRGTSDITSRLVQDAMGLQDGLKSILGSSVQESIKAVMALSAALWTSWELTVFILLFGPLMYVLIRKFGKKIRRAARAALQSSSELLGQIEGSLSGIRVVKAANAERFERRRFRQIIGNLVGQQLRTARVEAFNTPVLELLTLVVVCGIVLGAAYLVLVSRTLKAGEFFFVMACLMAIGESLRKVSKINVVLQKSNAAAGRLFELLDEPGEWPGRQSRLAGMRVTRLPARELAPIRREVRFDNVSFTYPGSRTPAVCNVSLAVPRGQSVAIVGRNGSGKTTLLSLLPRFFDPQRGSVLIDDVDIRQVTLRSLRRQIGLVTQDSVVFPGTVAQNIAYGMPLADHEQIVAAARRAFAHDFIMELPAGYETLLDPSGGQLSGGQKQRLCIARAILRQTPILILDEATSQVDAESEHLIQQAIQSIMRQCTTFVIAHRFSTIISANVIVVMDRGQIVGSGSHEELLRNCPTYQQLYERQLVAVSNSGG